MRGVDRTLTGILAIVVASASAAGQVFTRGHTDPLGGTVVSVGEGGVGVKGIEGGSGKFNAIVGWDVVRQVKGEFEAQSRQFAKLSDQAWRARARVGRGGVDEAEPLFEDLARDLRGKTGPTAAVVFEGLCRCRLARGAQAQAVAAWLEWVQASVDGGAGVVVIGGKVQGLGLIDEATGLMPGLPPIVAGEGASALAVLLDESAKRMEASNGGEAADLAMLYRAAARFEAGLEPGLVPIKTAREGVRLVRDVVQARVGVSEERVEARKRLVERVNTADIEPWIEAWCRCAIGRSLLRDDDEDHKRQGLVQMLHVPARFARISPSLAGLAVGEAAVWSAKLGDGAGAQALKGELEKAYPRHAANGWIGVREISVPKAAPVEQDGPRKEPQGGGKESS